MSVETLAQLLAPQSVTEIFNILLGVYQSNGFPVTSWQPGGVQRTRLLAIATAITDVSSNYIPTITAGGFVDYATGAWLQLLAQQLYSIDFNPATFTYGNVICSTTVSGAGAYTAAAGGLIFTFGYSGNRYINTGSVTIPHAGSVVVPVVAEFAGASYNDGSSLPVTLVNALPGVVVTNPGSTYTAVSHVGAGTGTITPSNTPTPPHQVIILINSSGAAGVASWSASIDGGVYTAPSFSATGTNLGGYNIDITLSNGASGTSFVLNDTYLFNCPGSWITTQGSDVETDTALALRCNERWSTLSPIPVTNFYELLVTSTPSVGSQVTQVVALPDSVINDRINLVCAGPTGTLPPATVALIQTYIDPRVPIGVNASVVTPSAVATTYGGVITAYAAQQASAQAAITTALNNYTANVGINGTVRISAVIETVMEQAGVIDIASTTINSVAANLSLGDSTANLFEVAEYPPTISFTYVTV